jgi:predicted component of type VI protein secretion system
MKKTYTSIFTADDFKNAANNIDDNSEHLPNGMRRSEELIAREEAAQNRARNKKKVKPVQTSEYSGDQPANIRIPHNRNRVSSSEQREDYIWIIPLAMVIFFLVFVWAVS